MASNFRNISRFEMLPKKFRYGSENVGMVPNIITTVLSILSEMPDLGTRLMGTGNKWSSFSHDISLSHCDFGHRLHKSGLLEYFDT